MQFHAIEGTIVKIMLLIAFRNLFRQKSRSAFIGIGICLSVAFIVVGNSLNKGMYRSIISNIIDSNLSGHCRINGFEKKGSVNMAVIRDKEEIVSRLKDELPNIKKIEETLTLTVYATVNGKSAYLGLTNMTAASVEEILNMKVVDGNISKLVDGSVANPLILEYKRAAALKVKPGDMLKARLTTIYGQVQTARLDLVATVKLTNSFMSTFMHGAMPTEKVKEIAGYGTHETQSLNIVFGDLTESDDMVLMADRIHRALESHPAVVQAEFETGEKAGRAILMGIGADVGRMKKYRECATVINGEIDIFEKERGKIHISRSLAEVSGVSPGSTIRLIHRSRFGDGMKALDLKVAGIIENPFNAAPYTAFINEDSFYDIYQNALPAKEHSPQIGMAADSRSPILECISRSWRLADRTYSLRDYEMKQRAIRKTEYGGSTLDVIAMQELADEVFKMESSQGATLLIVMLLVLSIIIVGIINTTKMTIRERIREIGTIRAIGMQKSAVVATLVTEMALLTFIASAAGILVACGMMELVSGIQFQSEDFNLAAILNNGHLYFKVPLGVIATNIFIVFLANLFAVYSPARKAAAMVVAKALGHHE